VILSIRNFRDVERLAVVHTTGALIYMVFAIRLSGGSNLNDRLFYYDPNGFAMIAVMTIPLAAYLASRRGSPLLRVLGIASLLLLLYSVVSSGSRGGFLGLVAVGIYMLLAFRAIPAMTRFATAALLLIGLLALGSDEYWQRMRTLLNPTEDYNWSGNRDTGRMEIWKRGVGYMVSFPAGVGMGNFERAEGIYAPGADLQEFGIGWKWNSAHNSFVEIGAELGFLGLFLFLAMIGSAIRQLYAVSRRPRDGPKPNQHHAAMAQALVGVLIAYCVTGFFLSMALSTYLYAALATVVGFLAVIPKPAPKRRPAPAPPPRAVYRQAPVMSRPAS
jgi:O-antigen ligase